MFASEDVLEIVHRIERAGISCWLDGGWAVDALLGRVTRPHDDLDLVVRIDDVAAVQGELPEYGPAPDAEPGMTSRWVLRDSSGRQVDLHPLRFDDAGDGWSALPDGSKSRYPAAELRERGQVGGEPVSCTSPALQLERHSGYEPDLIDWHDVRALGQATELPAPAGYASRPGWIHYRRKSVVRRLLGTEPPWVHMGSHRLFIPAGLLSALADGSDPSGAQAARPHDAIPHGQLNPAPR